MAALAAGALMAYFRWSLGVRTLPERLMEWVLIFVPPDLFEAGLQQFGFSAKRYALYAAIGIMLLVLAELGASALRRHRPRRAILLLNLGLWIFTMAALMPLTSAGFFATTLHDGVKAANGGYLTVALAYAACLMMFVSLHEARVGSTARHDATKRWTIVLSVSTLASFGGTIAAARLAPRSRLPMAVVLDDPQEPVPSGGIDPPNPHPSLVTTPTPATVPRQVDAEPAPRPEHAPQPDQVTRPAQTPPQSTSVPEKPAQQIGDSSTADGFTDSQPSRELRRDKDGAVLASGRQPDTLAGYITSNDDSYVVSKNVVSDPVLRSEDWRLRIDGDVIRPVEIDYATLRSLPAVEVTKTLECTSNFVANCHLASFACDLISTARWKGTRLHQVLKLAGGVKPNAVALSTISQDEFTTALPIDAALDPETLLVYEMNGQVLPREHGYPARILVPGRYGMKNVKWVVALRPTT